MITNYEGKLSARIKACREGGFVRAAYLKRGGVGQPEQKLVFEEISIFSVLRTSNTTYDELYWIVSGGFFLSVKRISSLPLC